MENTLTITNQQGPFIEFLLGTFKATGDVTISCANSTATSPLFGVGGGGGNAFIKILGSLTFQNCGTPVALQNSEIYIAGDLIQNNIDFAVSRMSPCLGSIDITPLFL